MYYAGNVQKVRDFTKKGNVQNVYVTDEGDGTYAKVAYNPETKRLEVGKGDFVVFMLKKFGVHEEALVECVPCEEGMLVTLFSGCIYVDAITESGDSYVISVDADNNVDVYEETSKHKIQWFDEENLKRCIDFRLNKDYDIPYDFKMIDRWYNNLSFVIRARAADNTTLWTKCEQCEVIGEGTLPKYELPRSVRAKLDMERTQAKLAEASKFFETSEDIDDDEDYLDDYDEEDEDDEDDDFFDDDDDDDYDY